MTKMNRLAEYGVIYESIVTDGRTHYFYRVYSQLKGVESSWISQKDAEERAEELNNKAKNKNFKPL